MAATGTEDLGDFVPVELMGDLEVSLLVKHGLIVAESARVESPLDNILILR